MRRPSDEQLRLAGASLREIDPSALTRDEDGSVIRWFLGEQGVELFAWSLPGERPHHVQLVIAGVTAEIDPEAGLRTGAFEGSASIAGGRYDPYVLRVSGGPDPEVCRAALLVLETAPPDAQAAAASLIDSLRRATNGALPPR